MACSAVTTVQCPVTTEVPCGAQPKSGCSGDSGCGLSEEALYRMMVESLIRQGLSQMEAEEQARQAQQSGRLTPELVAQLNQ